ncbi:hypothetical protein EJ02DRAFT_443465 [Clathrospora elynae]|uniref:Pyrroloquinoline quinone-dependent pyranose dehydrogenase beta-propeller domain-containing protein n=1 Tax=Clathrospora elynae TaxID=706981 RepID=A0A6A5SRD3_9PLEO|nr:hypothetical protein EJ02DRAFT_443465 [Clathrospora elynae]
MRLTGNGPCERVEGDVQSVVEDDFLKHGIALSQDGRTLYGSSHSNVYAWGYNGHTTRTLLLSQKVPGMLLTAFNVSNMTNSAYDHASSGLLLGWGLRNSVGVAEDPVFGSMYSVENSVDNIQRSGRTTKENNPGDEMNFHGFSNGPKTEQQGGNYGYPSCFAAWNVTEIPGYNGTTGSQFAIGDQNVTVNDTFCRNDRIAPRITFAAHMAPLDIKFNPNGTAANREEPIGYKLNFFQFDGKGSPMAPENSTTAAADIVSNPNISACPSSCFRPVGLAWDAEGRLFMSSDSTGDIYVVTRENGSGVANVSEAATGEASPNPTGSGGAPLASSTSAIGVAVIGALGGRLLS